MRTDRQEGYPVQEAVLERHTLEQQLRRRHSASEPEISSSRPATHSTLIRSCTAAHRVHSIRNSEMLQNQPRS